MNEKRFYITADGQNVRYIKAYITKDIEWDDGKTHLVVTMANSLNEANRPSDVQVESIKVSDVFATEKEAQWEIIRRERFEKK